MAQDKEPNSGYRNPNGNMSLETMKELGDLMEYVKLPLRERQCFPKNTMSFRDNTCFYCIEHAKKCMELLDK